MIAVAIGMSMIRGTALAAPTITVQPTSQTGVVGVGNSVTLSVTATAPGPVTYQWRKGGTALTEGGRIAGSQTAFVTINDLTAADFGYYDVVVSEGGVDVTSQTVSISPTIGAFNPLGGASAAQINASAYIESADSTAARGRPISATMPIGGVEIPVQIYYLPDQSGSAMWIRFPDGSRGDLNVGTCSATQSRVTVTWTGIAPESYCVDSAPAAGASMSVEQSSPGSLQIRATVMSPKFPGIVEPLVNDAYGVNFQVFDDTTGDLIPIGISGRLGVVRSLSGATMLQTVDPLVLPSSVLGTRIRVGALLYYYEDGWSNSLTLVSGSYAALSDPIFMTTGGDPSQWRRVPQALPMPGSGSCDDVADADYAWGTNLSGGWQKAWEPWVNPELDANGNRIGGWACTRVLVNRGGPWLIDNS